MSHEATVSARTAEVPLGGTVMATVSSFDPTKDTAIPLDDVGKLKWLPQSKRLTKRRDRKPSRISVQTVYRCALHGLRGTKLRTMRFGGVLCTTERWLVEFFAAISGPQVQREAAGIELQQQHERASRRLAAAGL
jgi:hypothetical protein